VGALVVVALGTVAGCGDGFASADCHESHTCGAAGDGAGGALDGSDTTAAGAGGSDGTSLGGAAPVAGAADSVAGAGGADTGCKIDAECSNDVAEDGAEVCDNGECLAGNAPPIVVSATPADEAVDVEPDTSVVIEFSEPLDPTTVTATTIQVLDGTTAVPGKLVYADGKVTFTPTAPLTLLAPYTLSVTTGVTDAEGTPLLTELSSTFQVRDGAWKTIDVVKDDITGMSDALPMTSSGRTLVAWNGSGPNRCPATARWYLRGVATTMVETFPVAGQAECEHISSGANDAGAAAVVWTSPTVGQGVTVQQYRDNAWLADAGSVSKNISSAYFRLVLAPSGATTVFEHDPYTGSVAWTTDAAGKWPATGNALSTHPAQGPTSAVIDSQGNGLAVWRAKAQTEPKLGRVVASRWSSATGKWAKAADLPGSVTATDTAERGNPVVALDSQGDGLALWVDTLPSGKLMASRFVQSAWTQPESISGALAVDAFWDAPGYALAFDGQAFVAAWTAQEGGESYAYTARYDLKTGWDPYQKQQISAADGTSATAPLLVSDGRGNLLLVYAKGAAPTYTLVYQRYAAGAWSAIKPVPGGTLSSQDLHTSEYRLALSASSNGLASLAWANYDYTGDSPMAGIRLASFY
jgi:hypothetical protein